jgi:hypothetical protein
MVTLTCNQGYIKGCLGFHKTHNVCTLSLSGGRDGSFIVTPSNLVLVRQASVILSTRETCADKVWTETC